MVKALIFDMDGTIVDNIPFHHQAWLNFLKKHDIEIIGDDFAAQNHGTADEMMIRFFGDHLSDAEIKELGYEKEKTYRELYRNDVKEIQGFTALLKIAQQHQIKIALATMGNTDNIDFILDRLNVKSYFDVIVGGHQVKHGKPHPEIYQCILDELHIAAGDCVAFEDSHGGVKAAQSAGIKVVGVGTAHTRAEFKTWAVDEYILTFDEYTAAHFAMV